MKKQTSSASKLRFLLATKWRRSLAVGASPRKSRGIGWKALKGRRSIQRLNLSVGPSGLDRDVCHETGGLHPRLNSVAALRLKGCYTKSSFFSRTLESRKFSWISLAAPMTVSAPCPPD